MKLLNRYMVESLNRGNAAMQNRFTIQQFNDLTNQK